MSEHGTPPRAVTGTDLDDVVDAIRTVQNNLERRWREACAVNVMIWGIVGALIFSFYHVASLNPAAYHATFHGFLHWVWAPIVGVGYVLTSIVSLNAGHRTQDPRYFGEVRSSLVSALIFFPMIAALVIFDQEVRIAGAVLIYSGIQFLGPMRATPERAEPRFLMGVWGVLLGLALFGWPQSWNWLAGALYHGLGLVGYGFWLRMRA